jgi:hypothetical protein
MSGGGGLIMKRDGWLLVMAITISLVSAGLYSLRVVPSSIALLGLGIIWISLLPSVIYLFSSNSPSIPLIPVMGLFYLVFFGLPVFTIPLAWPEAGSIRMYALSTLTEIRPEVLISVLIGVAALFIAFYGSHKTVWQKIPRFSLPPHVAEQDLRPLLWVLMIGHLAYEYIPELSKISSVGQFLGPVGYLAFGGLYLLWRRRRLLKIEILILILVCLPLEIYLRTHAFLLTDILLFLIFFILLIWHERQFLLLALCSALVISILSIYGASTVVRSAAPAGPERFILVGKALVAQMIYGKSEMKEERRKIKHTFDGRFGSVVKRTSQLWIYHIVDDKSPSSVPYWLGETYRPLLTSFIPRVFYPGKIEERVGNEFGRRYGILPTHEKRVSINLPWITELLANFGPWGVIWGMALIGVFLAFLDRVFNSRNSTDLEFIIGLTIIFPLVYPESNFSVMTGSMLPLFVSLYVYFVAGSWGLKNIPWFNKVENK